MIVLILPDTTDDDALLEDARAGNKYAVEAIYNTYFEPIYQFVRLRVESIQTTEDITSTVFLTFVRDIKRGKGPRYNLRAWLFKVARNKIADHYGQPPPLPLETVDQWFTNDDVSPEMQVINTLNTETIRSILHQLSADQQEVLLLRFDQQLSLQETSDIMGKNINTIKTLQLRALQKLRQLVQRSSAKG